MPRLRALLLLPLLGTLLSGCVGIAGTSSKQAGSTGAVTYEVQVCANGAPGCGATSNSASLWKELDDAQHDEEYDTQLLAAFRLPEGATPPASFNASVAGVLLAFTREPSYEQELAAWAPQVAEERWWGYRSATFKYGRKTAQAVKLSFTTALPRPADGGPYPSPLRWRPIVGARSVTAGLPGTRPVVCGTAQDHFYEGFSETGSAGATVRCNDSTAPDATAGHVTAPIVDFGLLGSAVQATPGATVSATFLAKRSGVPDPQTTYALNASGGPAGATVTLDRTSAPLGGDTVQPVVATIAVPPGTPAGTYPVTLTGTAPGKPARTAVATVTVAAPAAPPAGTGPGGTDAPPPVAAEDGGQVPSAPKDTTAPAITRAKLASATVRRGRAATLDLAVSEPATLTIVAERLVAGRRKGAACSTRATRGRRCTKAVRVGQLPATALGGGAVRLAIGPKVGTKRLAPGKHRLTLVVADTAGNRAVPRALTLTVGR